MHDKYCARKWRRLALRDDKSGGDGGCVKHVKQHELNNEADMREVAVLEKLSHKQMALQVVQLMYDQQNSDAFGLIFKHCDCDLQVVLREGKRCPSQTRSCVAQLVYGVAYIHARGIIHRDLAPANVWVKKVQHGMLFKIADSGMARPVLLASGNMTPLVVCTLWYRAPELLLGTTQYTTAVDMWSIGCMFVELMDCVTPFAGESDIDMLFKIFRVFGPPNAGRFKVLAGLVAARSQVTEFPNFKPRVPRWGANFGSGATEFIRGLIGPCPRSRWSAERAATHSIVMDEMQQTVIGHGMRHEGAVAMRPEIVTDKQKHVTYIHTCHVMMRVVSA
jgi:serine/threonine protein kinase